MNTDDPNKPKRRRLQVTEDAFGKNEMSRVKRRAVALPLREASEDDLQEFDENVHGSDSADMPFESRLICDLAAIEARLDELDLPPPRGWVEVRKDNSWAPLSEDKSARMVVGRGTMAEIHDPEASVWIETSVNYIKRRAEAFSLPWWLGHLGELIICILDESDPDKHRTLILSYGSDRQRYRDQQGHLDNAVLGRERREHNVKNAKQPKRRWWADILAERVSSWDEIPDSRNPLEIETLEADLIFYRDGKHVICAINGKEKKLARSTFEKRYLGSVGKRCGQ